jgi:predicted CXXCH cytochrome family protein
VVQRPFSSATVLLAAAIGLAACAATSAHLRGAVPRPAARVGVVASNVTAADYAGTASCAPCHSDLVNSFTDSPMHRMTRVIDTAEVRAPFAGETLRFKDDQATLEKRGSARFVRLERQGITPRIYRVTRVLGGHYREDFVGVPVPSEDAAPALLHGLGAFDHKDEVVLPVSYLIEQKRLRYKGYSVMVPERPSLEPGPVWNRTCLLCHNTSPYLVSLLGALGGPRAPHYQGEVVDALLDARHAFRYSVTDAALLAQAVASEVERESGAGLDTSGGIEKVLRRGADAVRDRLTGSGLLEVGIGCESCHGGCREHVQNPGVHPSFEPVAPFLAVTKATGGSVAPTRAELVNHACARCHQVLFSRYPYTWEGGKRYTNPGGSEINSGEGRDFLLGACSGRMTCSACHDPHAKDESARLAELATPAGNRVCLGCHGELTSPEALRAHAHHDPQGAGGACISCHMPKKNMSLDTGLTRYHRIGSPTDSLKVLLDRPLECALCHTDKTVGELTHAMETWWHKAYDKDALQSLYGDPTSNVLLATLERGKPHEKAVALSLLAKAGGPAPAAGPQSKPRRSRRELAPLFAGELANEYPLVREFARVALLDALADAAPGGTPAQARGKPCELSMYADLGHLEAEAEACLRAAGLPLPTWGSAPLPVLTGLAPGQAQAEPSED